MNTDPETYFVKRLNDHGVYVYPISAAYPAKERIRRAIIDAKLECSILGINASGKTETYQTAFERHYGESLQPASQPKGETS